MKRKDDQKWETNALRNIVENKEKMITYNGEINIWLTHTRPPYILSLKSLSPHSLHQSSSLLQSSKHSLSPVSGQAQAHSQVGEAWLKRYLEQKSKTESDLAKQLWDNNWTAIAEARVVTVFCIAFQLTLNHTALRWFVRRTCPPLPTRQNRAIPPRYQHLHESIPYSPSRGRRRFCRRMGIHQDEIHHAGLDHAGPLIHRWYP